ncbi:hypothetical protein FRB90_010024, partial [Tulasnella sp. 427]
VPEIVTDQEVADFISTAVDLTYWITRNNPNVVQTCKRTGNQRTSTKPVYQHPQPSIKKRNKGKNTYISKPPRLNKDPIPNIWLWNHCAYHPSTNSYNYWGEWNPRYKFNRKTGIKFDQAPGQNANPNSNQNQKTASTQNWAR